MRKFTEEHKRKLSEAKLNNPVRYWLGKKRPELKNTGAARTMFKKGNIPWHGGLLVRFGADNWNWKGGITPENLKIRLSARYRKWRKKIFERDAYTCGECGAVGGKLHAHHIRPFAKYPDLRLSVENGTTLCKGCHLGIHLKGKESKWLII